MGDIEKGQKKTQGRRDKGRVYRKKQKTDRDRD